MEVGQTITQTRTSKFIIQCVVVYDGYGFAFKKKLYWDNGDNADYMENHYILNFEFDNWKINLTSTKKGNFDVPSRVLKTMVFNSEFFKKILKNSWIFLYFF